MLPDSLLIPGKSYKGPLEPLSAVEQEIAKNLEKHVWVLAEAIGVRNLQRQPENMEKTAKYIEDSLSALGLAVTSQHFPVNLANHFGDTRLYSAKSQSTIQTRNVIAELPGTASGASIFVLGAHYDSVEDCPGANDNGSGVAATLELARLLKEKSLRKTLRFVAFANEESPYFDTASMGSMRYAGSCRAANDKIEGMVSLETMGYFSEESNSQMFPLDALKLMFPSQGNFIAFVSNIKSYSFLKKFVGSFRSSTKFPNEAASLPEQIPGVSLSDHMSFWKLGYPAIMVTDTAPFRYPNYHLPDDLPDKIDYERFARVVAGIARTIEELAR